jgi:hypothetical protein
VSTNGALPLGEVRARAALALAPVQDTDPYVLVDVVDAVSPPALMLLWDDPWLEPRTVGRGFWDARLLVLCIASRVEPGPGMAKLEELASYVVGRLRDDSYQWPTAAFQAPRVFTINNVPLLGARISYSVQVTV